MCFEKSVVLDIETTADERETQNETGSEPMAITNESPSKDCQGDKRLSNNRTFGFGHVRRASDSMGNSSVGATSETVGNLFKAGSANRTSNASRGLWLTNPVGSQSVMFGRSGSSRMPMMTGTRDSGTSKPDQHAINDVSQVQQMEQSLIRLMDDFHAGRLRAFGRDITFEQMERVREKQERLARMHFDLNAWQDVFGYESEEGRRAGQESAVQLMDSVS